MASNCSPSKNKGLPRVITGGLDGLSMAGSIGFPTQGEIIRFAYDAAGVLPRKHGDLLDFDETDKKTTQKTLERLASEKGHLSDRFSELTRSLAYVISGSIPSFRINLAIGDTLFDLFDVYNYCIRSNGSYLDKPGTIRWFLSDAAICRLVLSVNKHMLRFNVPADTLSTPDDSFWFMPSVDGETVTWPLAKVMKWAYSVCDTTQTLFHDPNKNASIGDYNRKQDLDNASNWLSAKSLPSWPALLCSFNDAFELLASCKLPENNRDIPETTRESIRTALFIARFSTYVCREIKHHYGLEYLAEIIEHYRRISKWISHDVAELKAVTANLLSKHSVGSDQDDSVRMKISEKFWKRFNEKAMHFEDTMATLVGQRSERSLPDNVLKLLVDRYGEFLVLPMIERLTEKNSHAVPKGFAEGVLDGMALKANKNATNDDIDRYEKHLQSSGVAHLMPWLVPWLRGIQLYRQDKFESAFEHFKSAFELGKYCAGNRQYELVNQYVEVCAKVDRWRDFKKGIEWARYLHIEIRHLGSDEPTEKNLRSVFALMKRYVYPV